MKYPNGSTIQAGDLIWWDEGHCVGFVQVVAESKDEYGSWRLDAPHIFVSNVHPFDPAIQTGVAYSESFLANDRIALLTPDERVQFDQATAKALELVAADLKYSTYSVLTVVLDCKLVSWIFTFRNNDGTELKSISVPVKHESNA